MFAALDGNNNFQPLRRSLSSTGKELFKDGMVARNTISEDKAEWSDDEEDELYYKASEQSRANLTSYNSGSFFDSVRSRIGTVQTSLQGISKFNGSFEDRMSLFGKMGLEAFAENLSSLKLKPKLTRSKSEQVYKSKLRDYMQKQLENEMIQFKRDCYKGHSNPDFVDFICFKCPDNIEIEDGPEPSRTRTVKSIDKRLLGVKWKGAFERISSTDSLHDIGDIPEFQSSEAQGRKMSSDGRLLDEQFKSSPRVNGEEPPAATQRILMQELV
jgi:hypothetical protein